MGAGTGTRGLKSKMVLRIRWRSSFKYLTTEELAKPEATSRATTSARAQRRARVTAGIGLRQLLSPVEIPPTSSSLPL